ncbi:MAG TPA: phospholipase [Microbacterium sp.]|nr:phospholipase [Microbacterium sp.]
MNQYETATKSMLLKPHRERAERRGKRATIITGSVVAALIVGGLVATGTAAMAEEAAGSRETGSVQLATGRVADQAQAAVDAAESVMERASGDGIDTPHLAASTEQLLHYASTPATIVSARTAHVIELTEVVTDKATAYEKRVAAEKKKAEEEAQAAAVAAAEAQAAANTPEGAKNSARDIMASTYGWGDDQFGCLDSLWTKESGWNYQASNASSGAYGIPQALPGSKMGTVAADWQTNATTQVTWGLDYISRAYGTPCAAWGHSQAMNWY